MAFQRLTKDQARAAIDDLVARYEARRGEIEAADTAYTESDARADFIDPLLEALGWDIANLDGRSQARRDVVRERSDERTDGGRPDYRLRVRGQDRLPVEAKKPSLRLATDADAALQARRYGFTLSRPSVLTNFAELVIFDFRAEPKETDGADVAVLPGCRFGFQEYLSRFDEIWDRLSYESVSERFGEVYDYEEPPRGTAPFDESFLSQFREWRRTLAADIATHNPELGAAEIGRRTQRLLNALLFMRVCEDRDIARYERLLASAEADELLAAFREADAVFDAGLFDVLDKTSVGSDTLLAIARELYWPRSKFAYGLLSPEVLAAVYEQSLAERVEVAEDGGVELALKPELAHAGGIVPTPQHIVEALVVEALGPQLEPGRRPPDDLRILDLSVGSGTFLAQALAVLAQAAEAAGAEPSLALRAELARRHLHGIDIDSAAVEVTRLSLLLAILGDEVVDMATARDVLPDLSGNIVVGNAVVGPDFDTLVPQAAAVPARRAAVAPLDIPETFPEAFADGGFDVVVGNPPYVRIQELAEHLPDQLAYFQHPRSPYRSSQSHNFDQYMLFVERGLEVLAPEGRLACIIPHRFTNGTAGAGVRQLLSARLERLVHFGESQVFPGRTTYTALVVAGPPTSDPAELVLAHDHDAWRNGEDVPVTVMPREDLTAAPWPIARDVEARLFQEMDRAAVARLQDEVDIFVGVQTSSDDHYFVQPIPELSTADAVTFEVSGRRWTVERGITRPALRDRPLRPYDSEPEPDALAIFPYDVVDEGGGRLRAVPLTAEEMAARYPLALRYFRAHEEELGPKRDLPDGRKVGRAMRSPGKVLWRYGRSQSLTKLDGPKVIVRVLSLVPQYALDTRGTVVPGGGDGGPYYLMRPRPDSRLTPRLLIALMSHPLVDAYIAARGRRYRGSYIVHRKAFMQGVPVPELHAEAAAAIEREVAEIHDLVERLRTEQDTGLVASMNDRIRFLRERIDRRITEAYGLGPDEVATLFE